MCKNKVLLAVALLCSGFMCVGTAGGEDIVFAPTAPPTAAHLVDYLNKNAERVEGLRCQVQLDVSADGQKVGLSGNLVSKGARCVRLHGVLLGSPAIDLGSNAEEYWYWAREDRSSRLARRSDENGRGPRCWTLLYRPEWLLDVLGIAKYDPLKKYDLKCDKKYFELSEPVLSPQGKPLRKVIVFHRQNQRDGQIAAVLLKDSQDKLLCRADIKKVYRDKKTEAFLAQLVRVTFPEDKVEIVLRLDQIKLGALPDEQAARVFTSKTAPFAKRHRSDEAGKKHEESTPRIAIDLARQEMTARYGDETLKLVGDPTTNLTLLILRYQLRSWIGEEKQMEARITCPGSLEFETAHAVLDACRKAGVRKIQLRARTEKGEKKEEQ